MRVSIWQQFSSNHSSYFTVVGAFPSEQEAQAAEARLRQFFTEVIDWTANLIKRLEAGEVGLSGESITRPTEPEQQISTQYGIQWYDEAMDWVYANGYPAVHRVDRLVFIQPDAETWQYGKPLADLMAHLGGESKVDGILDDTRTADTKVLVSITCAVPDEAAAQAIAETFEAYREAVEAQRAIDRYRIYQIETPWKDYARSESERHRGGIYSGQVSRTGRELHFDGLRPGSYGMALMQLVAFLRDKGCTEIRYGLTEKPYRE